MNIYGKNRFFLLLVAAFIVLSGCDKNKPPIVDSKTKTILLPFLATLFVCMPIRAILSFSILFSTKELLTTTVLVSTYWTLMPFSDFH